MPKKDTSKTKNPNSKRSLRRLKTGITTSRSNRRAEGRLSSALSAHAGMVKLSKQGGREFTKPGATNHW